MGFVLDVLDNHEDCDDKPDRKRPRVDNSSQDASLKVVTPALHRGRGYTHLAVSDWIQYVLPS